MAGKEANTTNRINWAFKLEKEWSAPCNNLKGSIAARLPEINILRINPTEVIKPVIVGYAYVEFQL
jgi:hypothetical protein